MRLFITQIIPLMTSDTSIIVKQHFNSSREALWKAITDQEQMTQWFFDNIPAFKPEVGFETEFVIELEERTFTHLWKIIEVVPFEKIKYHWSYKEYPGVGYVAFELKDEGTGTLLTLTNDGLESFPSHIPEFSRDSCIGGWNYFICGTLNEYMNS